MAAAISQREPRNHSGEILRQAERGGVFTVTVGGRPVALIGPCPRRQWVPRSEILRLLRSGPPDPELRQDIAELGGGLEELADPWEALPRATYYPNQGQHRHDRDRRALIR
ncbi:MAG TPA: hypothetical protein DD490_09020 [Acidobacteria bacterium]|nr:hypothetical protein [Acidobacteriota bacterium]